MWDTNVESEFQAFVKGVRAFVCVRACVRACVHACVRVCACCTDVVAARTHTHAHTLTHSSPAVDLRGGPRAIKVGLHADRCISFLGSC